jgi:hypothetical protein
MPPVTTGGHDYEGLVKNVTIAGVPLNRQMESRFQGFATQ